MRLYLDKVFFVDVMYKKNMNPDSNDLRNLSSPFKMLKPHSEPKMVNNSDDKNPHQTKAVNLQNHCTKDIFTGSDCKLKDGSIVNDITTANKKLKEEKHNIEFHTKYKTQKAGKRRRRRTTRRRKSSKASKKSRRRRRSHKRRR